MDGWMGVVTAGSCMGGWYDDSVGYCIYGNWVGMVGNVSVEAMERWWLGSELVCGCFFRVGRKFWKVLIWSSMRGCIVECTEGVAASLKGCVGIISSSMPKYLLSYTL